MLTPDLGAGAVSSQINSRRMSSDDYICYFTTFWTTHLTSSFYLHSLLFLIVLVQPSLLLCFPFDAKAKFYRRESEVLSNIYRRPIEHLSNRACGNFLMPLYLQSLSVALIYLRFMIHYSRSCDGQYAALLRIIHFGDEWIADSLLFNLSH